MITIKYLADLEGSEKYGSCVACDKDHKQDSRMVRVIFDSGSFPLSICLCDDCRKELCKKI